MWKPWINWDDDKMDIGLPLSSEFLVSHIDEENNTVETRRQYNAYSIKLTLMRCPQAKADSGRQSYLTNDTGRAAVDDRKDGWVTRSANSDGRDRIANGEDWLIETKRYTVQQSALERLGSQQTVVDKDEIISLSFNQCEA